MSNRLQRMMFVDKQEKGLGVVFFRA
jgi:hypothetical protein